MRFEAKYDHCVYLLKLSCPLLGTECYTELIYEPSNKWTATKVTVNFRYEPFKKNQRWMLDNNSLWSIVDFNAEFYLLEEQHGHQLHLSLPDENNESVLTLHRRGRPPRLIKIFYFPLH